MLKSLHRGVRTPSLDPPMNLILNGKSLGRSPRLFSKEIEVLCVIYKCTGRETDYVSVNYMYGLTRGWQVNNLVIITSCR